MTNTWLRNNRLTLNASKTCLVMAPLKIEKKCEDFSIKLDDIEITHKELFKYLSIIVDPTLSFSRHVDFLISKSIGHFKILSKTHPIISSATSLMLYKTICISVFDYCDIIYDCLTQRDIFRLQKIQNSTLCIIS